MIPLLHNLFGSKEEARKRGNENEARTKGETETSVGKD
jgi:hypothetical protein